jgi:diadenosine tetraphosphate (Ap4A) HIT family hydrolase
MNFNKLKTEKHFALHPQLEKDTYLIGSLELSEILLMNDSRYPWIILVPRIIDAIDITDLTAADRADFMEEINHIAKFMKQHFQPDRLNIAMLGNIVPQLHCHIIARYETDFAWAKPVWGIGDAVSYTEEQQEKTISLLQSNLFTEAKSQPSNKLFDHGYTSFRRHLGRNYTSR